MLKNRLVATSAMLLFAVLIAFAGSNPSATATATQEIGVLKCRLLSRDLDLVLKELCPEVKWSDWYRRESGYVPHPDHFGAYVTLPVGNVLYIGLGSARPAEGTGDGALVASLDGDTLESIGPLTEQGCHDMLWYEDTLHIAGTDPCCGGGWSAGNHYTYTPREAIVKHRDPAHGLVEVVHTWGMWMSDEGVLYAAVSSVHSGASTGEILRSTDNGVTWTKLSKLGAYRAYDIFGFQGRLYALYSDVLGGPLTLAVSKDGGETWTDIIADDAHLFRLVEFRDRLLVTSWDRTSIYAVGGSAAVRYDLPEGVVLGTTYASGRNYNYNLLSVANRHLYTIWEEDRGGSVQYSIVHTRDLLNWERLVATEKQLISLSFWQARHWCIVSEHGADAKLWKLELPFALWLPVIQQHPE
jgi:hypothetical protein